ncbi:MAG TPA: uracil-DNA glycosylase family protein [Alphaproteobacteria bacterium]|nr:uracil-DNA glycosylase family protein [Alphaproteobacteria bacterium]
MPADIDDPLAAALAEARACRRCAEHLPLGPRPVVRAGASARLLIIGQAPGTKVHETGIPWNDRSGDRLRDWLGLDRKAFYDEDRVAIVPMGFCYPGLDRAGGDKPPRRECAPLWHPRLLPLLPAVELTLLVGSYAQAHYLGSRRKRTMSDTVRAWRDYLPDFLPLPHPSWRNTAWLRKNPWFEAEVLPWLQAEIGRIMETPAA